MSKLTIYHVMIIIALVYFLFPTNNSSLDSYAYAGYIKYGENLFSPHHLLYNAFLYVLISPIKVFLQDVEILLLAKYINTVFVLINLIIFYKILSKLDIDKNEKLLYVFMVAFSFSLLRFGTENETYIIPIAFSLYASLQFLNFIKTKNYTYIFISGLFASIACLFHQIHFFWWFGLFVGTVLHQRRLKDVMLYSVSALIVPVSYILVLKFYQNQQISFVNLLNFVLHDFYTGSAQSELGWKNFFFILVSSFRTFFQLHPINYLVIKKNILFAIPIFSVLYLAYCIIKSFFKKELIVERRSKDIFFINTHFWILLFQFLFAFYAVGNVEFMVMIPFLLVIGILTRYRINQRVLVLLPVVLFIWNFSYGIYPNNKYDYYNDKVLVNFIIDNPNELFVVKNDKVLNMFYYQTGKDNYKNIYLYNKLKSESSLYRLIDNKGFIFTDVIKKPTIFNRAKIISLDNSQLDFGNYVKEEIFTYKGLYGNSKVYKIKKK